MQFDSIHAFGCSNTYGTEAITDYDKGLINDKVNNNYAYPRHLADMFGCSWHNYAVPGCSNQEIATKVFNTVKDKECENSLIIIGWTDDERISIGDQEAQTRTFTHEELYEMIRNKKLREKMLNEYPSHLTEDTIIGILLSIFPNNGFHDLNFFTKYATTSFLKAKNIHHFTFHTLNPRYNYFYNLLSDANNMPSFDNNGNVIFDMLKKFKRYGTSSCRCHLKEAGHKALAFFLFREILKRKV
jgi:hypothetical protein